MSTFSDAIRRNQQGPAPQQGTSAPPAPVRVRGKNFSLLDRGELHRAEADMEFLYKSINSALAGIPGGKMLLFASSRPGEGKTTVVAALATTMAKSLNYSVLVIDASRGKEFSSAFHDAQMPLDILSSDPAAAIATVRERTGSTVVTTSIDLASIVPKTGPAGSIVPVNDLAMLKAHFQYILVDVASFAESARIVSLSRQMDGVVLVVEAERTRWPVVRYTVKEFEKVQARMLGIFLNKRRFYIPPKVYQWL